MIRFNHKIPFNLYVLKLIQGKYYVGITQKNVSDRLNQHLIGKGAQWTKLYKPIGIIESFITSNIFEEDKLTKMYLDKFGINNVRGGSYSRINLEEFQIKAIELELKSANCLCYKCGRHGHFTSGCKVIRKIFLPKL
jgi:hypothetical protein